MSGFEAPVVGLDCAGLAQTCCCPSWCRSLWLAVSGWMAEPRWLWQNNCLLLGCATWAQASAKPLLQPAMSAKTPRTGSTALPRVCVAQPDSLSCAFWEREVKRTRVNHGLKQTLASGGSVLGWRSFGYAAQVQREFRPCPRADSHTPNGKLFFCWVLPLVSVVIGNNRK